jgi:alpha/beta superfamily hydrolase
VSKERIAFENDAGGRLSGDLYWPAVEPVAFVLFAHCFTCTARAKAAVTIARALNQAGFAVPRFDFTGLDDSGGDFSGTTFASNIGDLARAAEFLATRCTAR